MIYHPIAFLVILAGFIALMIWALPKLWRLIKRLFLKVKVFFTQEELRGLDYQPEDNKN
jgi:hypothetical protein